MPINILSFIVNLKLRLFKALKWPIDKLEALFDQLLTKLMSVIIKTLS